ncbi:N-acetylmuramidase domain-containing protein [Aureimonas mangrovi]|uniref:N-acetylmuramidase domain-containing protein n=1 Tax=Aureimonas mangrovi TaxID=2758041 RepID=UPI00163DD813|nr:N-acetylmuramidase domain-containing protein [Aureimonas mangrovi]
MKIADDVLQAARSTGEAEGVSPAVLIAVAWVETRAQAFAPVGRRREPLIRFEGHYFDRLLAPGPRTVARTAGLAHPSAGRVRNPSGQAARWAMIERAAAIDRRAAWQSTSWGLGQVMGEHWRRLGYASVEALAKEARGSIEGQFRLMARFLRVGALSRLLPAGDVKGFARRYNGPAYARNGYDTKIAGAFAEAQRLLGDIPDLALGARGAAVTSLQRALAAAGHPLAVDGIFGPKTQAALRKFQVQAGLAASGVLDGPTRVRMAAAA